MVTTTNDIDRVRAALSGLKIALAADHYDMDICSYCDRRLDITIKARPEACPDCLLPEGLMVELIRTQLPSDIMLKAVCIKIRNLQ